MSKIETLIKKYLRVSGQRRLTHSYRNEQKQVLADMTKLCEKPDPQSWTKRDCYSLVLHNHEYRIATRARRTHIMKAFWSWAEKDGHIPLSPARDIIVESVPLQRLVVPKVTVDTIESMRPHMQPFPFAVLASIWGCALRASDIKNITEKRIDDKKMLFAVSRKGYPTYYTPISDLGILAQLYKIVEQDTLRGWSKSTWQRGIVSGFEKAGFKPIEPGQIRLACIRRWLSENHSPFLVAEWAGIHPKTLFRYYDACSFEDTWPAATGLL